MPPQTPPQFADGFQIAYFEPKNCGEGARTRSLGVICTRVGLALLCYPVMLLVAFRWTHSAGEFLVLGFGPALLLDRYVFRLLPWTYPLRWTKELFLRGAYVGLGGVGFSLVRAGMIRAEEAFSLGLALSLAAFLFECFISFGARGCKGLARCSHGKTVHNPWSIVRASLLRSADLGLQTTAQHPLSGWSPLHHLLFFCPVIVFTLPLFALHMPRTVPAESPAALQLPFEDIHFRTGDGLDLSGWLVPHEQARGSLIFCHGHGQNRGQVLGCLTILHELRLNVLAFDFRGHGDSPGHTETFGRREVKDLIAADAEMQRRFPGQPIFLMGVSYGAAVALQALPFLPHVQALWSESSFSHFNTVVEQNFSWLPAAVRRPVERMYLMMAWLDCGIWGNEITPVGSIARLHVPICFCHGMDDELVPFADGKSLYDAYTGPKWHYWAENAGHNNLQQRAPGEYRRRLRGFFEEMLDR